MNSKCALWTVSVLLAVLLGCTIITFASAGEISRSPLKDLEWSGKNLTVTMILDPNGTLTKPPDETINGKIPILKGIEIPDTWKQQDSSISKPIPSDQDWEYIRSIMTGLSDKEKDRLIDEMHQIYNGTSTLSKEEQLEITQQIGEFLIQAEENSPAILWYGVNGHWQMSVIAADCLNYVTDGHTTTLGDYSGWADNNRNQPPFYGLIANRHSWVLDEPGFPGFDNYGPDSCEYFEVQAQTQMNQYNVNGAYIDIGKSLHYIEDMGCPFHTSMLVGQEHHSAYEGWVSLNWNDLESALRVDSYYIVGDPSDASKYIAWYSHQKLARICDIMDTPNWESTPALRQEMVTITRDLFRETAMMNLGMIDYVTKCDSPNTIGQNRVAISDFSTSYAYLDNIPCSNNMYLCTYITHSNIGNLEIWLGWKDESSSTYTEVKIWDHQGYGTQNLALCIGEVGFQNIHDWRLRVVDGYSGDQGYIEEFCDLVG
jgi:hypothetical protein